MCEFKVINKGQKIAEEILVLSYTDANELVFKDILGMGSKLESALILDVNTINTTVVVVEHTIIKNFVSLVKKIEKNIATVEDVDIVQNQLDSLKIKLKNTSRKT